MPSISANRPYVDDRFPMLGFTVRTGQSPSWFEVVLTAGEDVPPEKRSAANFWTSRSLGPQAAPKGEAVFLVPADVLARFAGQDRVYYRLAVSGNADLSNPQVVPAPAGRVPSVSLAKSFTGRSRRMLVTARASGPRGRDRTYAGKDVLTWSGDQPSPGQAAPAAPAPTNGSAPVAAQSGFDPYDHSYDDGFGALPAAAASDEGALVTWPRTPQQAAGVLRSAGRRSNGYGRPMDADDGSEHGIEGPIPDAPPAQAAALARAADDVAPDYPYATRFVSAAPGNYSPKTGERAIRRVVIHITDGGANINGTIGWFQNPDAKVSAHYVIGQDGEIVQMVRHRDVAWHAGRANGDSIGIEHVANTRGLTPTDAQYRSSAALVAWLCDQYGLAKEHVTTWGDGATGIQGHAEADTGTSHRACPNAVWDWGAYMGYVRGDAPAPAAAESLGRNGNGRRTARPFAQVTPADASSATEFLKEFADRKARWSAGVSDTTFYPFSAICHLQITGSDGKTYTGTAFYIGPDKLLTAGHNLKDTDGWTATSITVTPGKNGSARAGASFTVSPSDWVTHPSYVPGNRDFDMGVILTSTPPPSGWFFEVIEELTQSLPSTIIVCGYSAATVDSTKQHLDGDMVRTVGDETLEYNLQTEGGASGSPVFYVWAREDDERQQSVLEHHVVGVHVSGLDSTLNRCCRLTEAKIQWINSVRRDSSSGAATFGYGLARAAGRSRPMSRPQARRSARPFEEVDPILPSDPVEAFRTIIEFVKRKAAWQAGVSNTDFFPHSAICRLKQPDGSAVGTGFYIGQGKLLTAAHCLDGEAELVVYPGLNGGAELVSNFHVTPADWAIHPRYVDGNHDFDLGVILVNQAPPRGQAFDILEELTQSKPSPIIVTGYSNQITGAPADVQHMDGDMIREVDDEKFRYNLQTKRGQSGSPVYYLEGIEDDVEQVSRIEHRLIGVHVSGAGSTLNQGCRLTADKITWINQVGRDPSTGAVTFGYRSARAMGAGNGRRPGRYAVAKQTAPAPHPAGVAVQIASTVAGAVMTRILNNEGDVKWELEQLDGLKHIGDNAANAGSAAYQDGLLEVPGFVVKQGAVVTDDITATFEVSWQYNGRSLGNVTISPAQTNDAVLNSLKVTAQITPDGNTYTDDAGGEFAALKLTFIYVFSHTVRADAIGRIDVKLFGNGTTSIRSRWTQRP